MFDKNRSSDKITEILTDIKDDNSSNSFDEKSMNNNNLKFILESFFALCYFCY